MSKKHSLWKSGFREYRDMKKRRNKQLALIKLGFTKRMLWSHTHTEPSRDEHIAMNASRDNQRQAGGLWRHTHACGEKRWSASAPALVSLREKGGMWRRGVWEWLIVQHSKKHEDQKRGVGKMKKLMQWLAKCEWQHHDVGFPRTENAPKIK